VLDDQVGPPIREPAVSVREDIALSLGLFPTPPSRDRVISFIASSRKLQIDSSLQRDLMSERLTHRGVRVSKLQLREEQEGQGVITLCAR